MTPREGDEPTVEGVREKVASLPAHMVSERAMLRALLRRMESDESERDAVVAWLRAEADSCEKEARGSSLQITTLKSAAYIVAGCADDIARGAHRKGDPR